VRERRDKWPKHNLEIAGGEINKQTYCLVCFHPNFLYILSCVNNMLFIPSNTDRQLCLFRPKLLENQHSEIFQKSLYYSTTIITIL
jgi:hypothetical protein